MKVELGQLMMTRNAIDTLVPESVYQSLSRYIRGDWGDVDKEDWVSNDRALKTGARLLGSYKDKNDVAFWIITEADRSMTTILLPEDY